MTGVEAGSRECLCVCEKAASLDFKVSRNTHHIHKSRAEEGGEPATSTFPAIHPILVEYLPQLITGIVTPWKYQKTISMITRTNKISNCYHPSHLPPLQAQGGAEMAGGAARQPPRFVLKTRPVS